MKMHTAGGYYNILSNIVAGFVIELSGQQSDRMMVHPCDQEGEGFSQMPEDNSQVGELVEEAAADEAHDVQSDFRTETPHCRSHWGVFGERCTYGRGGRPGM